MSHSARQLLCLERNVSAFCQLQHSRLSLNATVCYCVYRQLLTREGIERGVTWPALAEGYNYLRTVRQSMLEKNAALAVAGKELTAGAYWTGYEAVMTGTLANVPSISKYLQRVQVLERYCA
jgi:hypothetical protein